MSLVRRAIPFCLALAVVAPAHGGTAPALPKVPAGLHGFMLRADEPVTYSFAQTPSFAWRPVPGAFRYEFELSKSRVFAKSGVIWTGSVEATPAISVPISLPWLTGDPYGFYTRVRAVTSTGKSPWSEPYGFNLVAPEAPAQSLTFPGLVRWSTVEGATSYQVWWWDIGKQIATVTNSADQREFYTFHQHAPWPDVVRWRVRAVRSVGAVPNGLPAVTYSEWSPVYTSFNPPFTVGPLTLSATTSETVGETAETTAAHPHVPAFLFGGTESLSQLESELYRVYVATDKDCTNIVFRGAVVGGPAYAPRTSGPLSLPKSEETLGNASLSYAEDGSEGTTLMGDGEPMTTSESVKAAPSAPAKTGFTLPAAQGALVDLADSGWPSGLYYWTVVPVEIVTGAAETIVYRDVELPSEACAAGRVGSFGTESSPVVTGDRGMPVLPGDSPFVSGLSTRGRLIAAAGAKPTVYGSPLVAWRPALGAVAYEVQRSRSLSPWRTVDKPLFTLGTSVLLRTDSGKRIAPGTWYYRVRGLNPYVGTGAAPMSWSKPAEVVVAKPTFTVLGWTVSRRGK